MTVGGVHYGQKAHALRALIDLPAGMPGARFEPALSIHPGDGRDRDALLAAGWRVLDPAVVADDPDRYRRFVAASTAEIGVAKSGYVASATGWFSDRSACYLACGRPVVAQDTGWTRHLPAGEGLLAFSDTDSAAAAVAEVLSDQRRHAKAARLVAEDLLDARLVLARLLDRAGVAP
jgi:glycosyltransferase involved in cell wall biosynthesis